MSQVKAHEKNIRWNALSLVLLPLYVWTIDKHKELYPLNLDDWTEINFLDRRVYMNDGYALITWNLKRIS